MTTKPSEKPEFEMERSPLERGELDQGSEKRPVTEVLVELLTTKVRLLSLEQVTDLCFLHTKTPRVIARKHLRRMEKKGLLNTVSAMTLKEFPVEKPLLDWHPGDGLPDFGHLSWLAEKRLATPLVSTLVVQATRVAQAKTLGPIGGRPPRSQEITHDLLVASVFQHLWKDAPGLAHTWRPEDALLQDLVMEAGNFTDAVIPDAVVRDGGDEIAIDVVGRYSPKKLATLHEVYGNKRYQLW